MRPIDPLITLTGASKPGMPPSLARLFGMTLRKSEWAALGYALQLDQDFRIEPIVVRELGERLVWTVALESLFFESPEDLGAFRLRSKS